MASLAFRGGQWWVDQFMIYNSWNFQKIMFLLQRNVMKWKDKLYPYEETMKCYADFWQPNVFPHAPIRYTAVVHFIIPEFGYTLTHS